MLKLPAFPVPQCTYICGHPPLIGQHQLIYCDINSNLNAIQLA